MKLRTALGLTILLTATATAQTVFVPGGTVGNSNNGNVGIGTNAPSDLLEVVSASGTASRIRITQATTGTWTLSEPAGTNALAFSQGGGYGVEYMRILGGGGQAGFVGIGTSSPLRRLHLYEANGNCALLWEAGTVPSASAGRIWSWATDSVGNFNLQALNGNLTTGINAIAVSPTGAVQFSGSVLDLVNCDTSGGASDTAGIKAWNTIRLYSTCGGYTTAANYGISFSPRDGGAIFKGNVGIGTTSPTYPLSVNGTVRAKEVIVDTGWSDYVFADNYKLAPLSEVERHTKTEKHLPGIPSAQEVADHGVSMGVMQAKLLAKIEELTLHVIEQEKRIDAQQIEIANLKAGKVQSKQ